MAKAYWRKRVGSKSARTNFSYSQSRGFGASLSTGSRNKKGLGWNYNTKSGLTLSLRGTGLKLELGGGIQKPKRKGKSRAQRLAEKEHDLSCRIDEKSRKVYLSIIEINNRVDDSKTIRNLDRRKKELDSIYQRLREIQLKALEEHTYYNHTYSGKRLVIDNSASYFRSALDILPRLESDIRIKKIAIYSSELEEICNKDDISIEEFSLILSGIKELISPFVKNSLTRKEFTSTDLKLLKNESNGIRDLVHLAFSKAGEKIDTLIDSSKTVFDILEIIEPASNLSSTLVNIYFKSGLRKPLENKSTIIQAINGTRINLLLKASENLKEISNSYIANQNTDSIEDLAKRYQRMRIVYERVGPRSDLFGKFRSSSQFNRLTQAILVDSFSTREKLITVCISHIEKDLAQLENTTSKEIERETLDAQIREINNLTSSVTAIETVYTKLPMSGELTIQIKELEGRLANFSRNSEKNRLSFQMKSKIDLSDGIDKEESSLIHQEALRSIIKLQEIDKRIRRSPKVRFQYMSGGELLVFGLVFQLISMFSLVIVGIVSGNEISPETGEQSLLMNSLVALTIILSFAILASGIIKIVVRFIRLVLSKINICRHPFVKAVDDYIHIAKNHLSACGYDTGISKLYLSYFELYKQEAGAPTVFNNIPLKINSNLKKYYISSVKL